MGGLWKMAAMSAVIGAGLVVVWQAQQGLQLQSVADAELPTAPALSGSDVQPEPSSGANLTPVRSATASEATPTLAPANASIPPENEPTLIANAAPDVEQDLWDSAAPPAKTPRTASPAKPAARTSSGIDFRLSQAKPETTSSPEATTEPQLKVADDEGSPLLPVPEPEGTLPASIQPSPLAAPSNIQLTAGEAAPIKAQVVPAELPADDPFSDAAPPPMLERGATSPAPAIAPPAQNPAEFDPFEETPAPQPTLPATPGTALQPKEEEAFDPFGDSSPRLPASEPRRESAPATMPAPAADPLTESAPASEPAPRAGTPPLPADLDNFEPFPGGSTAPVERKPPSRSVNPPLPLELDAEPAEPANNNPAMDDFDPFGAVPAPTAPAPAVTPSEPPAANPAPADTPIPEEPAPERRPPSRTVAPSSEMPAQPETPANPNGLFQGDGEASKDVPRGVQEPRLTIEKLAPSSAVLGQPLIYSVVVKNVGGSPATQVTVEDRIPRGSRLVGTAPQAELIERRLVWRKLGTLQPGEERKISIKVIPEEEGPIGSVAKVSFISEVAAEIVVRAPKLTLAVQPTGEVKVGETVPLVFQLSNPGDGAASNVILRCILPEGLQHPAGNDLEYTVGELKSKETREVRLEVSAMKPGQLSHQTVVTADGNLSTESRTTINVVGEDLLLTRSGHDRVYLGRNAVFTNSVTNEGQTAVNGVQLSEGVPAGFQFVSATHGGTYSESDRKVNWKLGSLPPGGAATVSVTLVAKEVGEFDTTVMAAGPTGSAATVRPVVSIEGYPALALERLGEERLVGVGETITTKIQLQNRGTADARGVAVTIDLPTELKFVSATGPSRYRLEGQRLTFDPVDTVAARGSAAYELVLEAQSPGDSRLELQVSAEHLRRPVRHDEALQVLAAP